MKHLKVFTRTHMHKIETIKIYIPDRFCSHRKRVFKILHEKKIDLNERTYYVTGFYG